MAVVPMNATGGADATGGVRSLDGALALLKVLAAADGPVALGALAKSCAMPPSKAHRYLASFVHAGLARTDGAGRYDLGPAAAEIGLAALSRRDVVNAVADALPALTAETGLTALLAVWGPSGPVVVRWQRAPAPVVTSLGLGTTLPLLSSATGRAFLGFLPPAMTEAAAARELRALGPERSADLGAGGGIGALRDRVRAQGVAAVDGRFIPGLAAVAAPVTDWQGEAEVVVTLIGTDAAAVHGRAAALLASCARHRAGRSA